MDDCGVSGSGLGVLGGDRGVEGSYGVESRKDESHAGVCEQGLEAAVCGRLNGVPEFGPDEAEVVREGTEERPHTRTEG